MKTKVEVSALAAENDDFFALAYTNTGYVFIYTGEWRFIDHENEVTLAEAKDNGQVIIRGRIFIEVEQ